MARKKHEDWVMDIIREIDGMILDSVQKTGDPRYGHAAYRNAGMLERFGVISRPAVFFVCDRIRSLSKDKKIRFTRGSNGAAGHWEIVKGNE